MNRPYSLPLRQVAGVIILALIALYGYQQLTTPNPPSTGGLARELEANVNETAAFEGRLSYVRAVACKSNGGNFFVCRGEYVDEEGQVEPVAWNVDTTDGHVRATSRP